MLTQMKMSYLQFTQLGELWLYYLDESTEPACLQQSCSTSVA